MEGSLRCRRTRIDYTARAKAEYEKALAYPENEPNKAAWKNKYRAALRRASRHARLAVFYGQWTGKQWTAFERRIDAVWK